MDRFVDSWYVVTGVVTVRKRDRPTLIVSLQVFCLVLLNVICGHVCRICAKGRNGQSFVLRSLFVLREQSSVLLQTSIAVVALRTILSNDSRFASFITSIRVSRVVSKHGVTVDADFR